MCVRAHGCVQDEGRGELVNRKKGVENRKLAINPKT